MHPYRLKKWAENMGRFRVSVGKYPNLFTVFWKIRSSLLIVVDIMERSFKDDTDSNGKQAFENTKNLRKNEN